MNSKMICTLAVVAMVATALAYPEPAAVLDAATPFEGSAVDDEKDESIGEAVGQFGGSFGGALLTSGSFTMMAARQVPPPHPFLMIILLVVCCWNPFILLQAPPV